MMCIHDLVYVNLQLPFELRLCIDQNCFTVYLLASIMEQLKMVTG